MFRETWVRCKIVDRHKVISCPIENSLDFQSSSFRSLSLLFWKEVVDLLESACLIISDILAVSDPSQDVRNILLAVLGRTARQGNGMQHVEARGTFVDRGCCVSDPVPE